MDLEDCNSIDSGIFLSNPAVSLAPPRAAYTLEECLLSVNVASSKRFEGLVFTFSTYSFGRAIIICVFLFSVIRVFLSGVVMRICQTRKPIAPCPKHSPMLLVYSSLPNRRFVKHTKTVLTPHCEPIRNCLSLVDTRACLRKIA